MSETTNTSFELQINDDPAKWVINDVTIDVLLQRDIAQNMDADFSLSKRLISGQYRSMNKSLFTRTLKNGNTQQWSWYIQKLVYSESKLAVFCAPCLLFGQQSTLTDGYNDWNNIHKRLQEHENCLQHKSNTMKMLDRSRPRKKSRFLFKQTNRNRNRILAKCFKTHSVSR